MIKPDISFDSRAILNQEFPELLDNSNSAEFMKAISLFRLKQDNKKEKN